MKKLKVKLLTEGEAFKILEKIDVHSDYPWKHELNYLRDTLRELYQQKEILDGLTRGR